MEMDEDLYGILGICADATPREVDVAYRKLAMRFHPDKNRGDPSATSRFQRLQSAYAVLSDPDQRSAYDCRTRGVVMVTADQCASTFANCFSVAVYYSCMGAGVVA